MFNGEGRRVSEMKKRRGPAGLPLAGAEPSLKRWVCGAGRRSGLGASVGLDDVLDGAAADGAAGVQSLLEAQAAGIAEAHVTTCVDDRVHRMLIADGALVAPLAQAWSHW